MDVGSYNLKLTPIFGLCAWLGVLLATAGLFMFYKCSRYGNFLLQLLCLIEVVLLLVIAEFV